MAAFAAAGSVFFGGALVFTQGMLLDGASQPGAQGPVQGAAWRHNRKLDLPICTGKLVFW